MEEKIEGCWDGEKIIRYCNECEYRDNKKECLRFQLRNGYRWFKGVRRVINDGRN